GDLAELVDGVAAALILLIEEGLHRAAFARHRKHAGEFDHRLDVRLLEHALLHRGGGGLRRLVGNPEAIRRRCHRLRRGKVDELQLAESGLLPGPVLAHRNGAVGCNRDAMGVGGNDERLAAIGQHRIALAGDDLALAVELEMAVPRVADAERRLNREIPLAGYRQVERIAGLGNRPLAQVAYRACILNEGDRAALPARAYEVLAEQHLLPLEG